MLILSVIHIKFPFILQLWLKFVKKMFLDSLNELRISLSFAIILNTSLCNSEITDFVNVARMISDIFTPMAFNN